MKEIDELGTRMKGYEKAEIDRKLDLTKPIYARIDGKSFHTLTRNMEKPFDRNLSHAMIEATIYLTKETGANIGYTQSDEISLIWKVSPGPSEEMLNFMFDGKVYKLTSVLASIATAVFSKNIETDRLAFFDTRIINLPDEVEAANMLLWRTLDARKNAIHSLARSYFTHREIQNKSQKDMLEMLKEKQIEIETHPKAFTDGTFIQKRSVERYLTPEELSEIPIHKRPTTPVIRSYYKEIDMPQFKDVTNRADVIFRRHEPTTKQVS